MSKVRFEELMEGFAEYRESLDACPICGGIYGVREKTIVQGIGFPDGYPHLCMGCYGKVRELLAAAEGAAGDISGRNVQVRQADGCKLDNSDAEVVSLHPLTVFYWESVQLMHTDS